MNENIDRVVDDQASCKVSCGSPDDQLEWLKEDLERERKMCQRFSKENALLANMYADEVYRRRMLEESLDDADNKLHKIRNNIYMLHKTLFEDGKVRMSKETEKLIRKFLSF